MSNEINLLEMYDQRAIREATETFVVTEEMLSAGVYDEESYPHPSAEMETALEHVLQGCAAVAGQTRALQRRLDALATVIKRDALRQALQDLQWRALSDDAAELVCVGDTVSGAVLFAYQARNTAKMLAEEIAKVQS